MKSKMNIKNIFSMAVLTTTSMMFLNMSLAANIAKVAEETVNLRQSDSSDSEIVGQLSQNEEVEILENLGDWCKVKANGTEGYVKTSLLNMENSEENTNTTEGEQQGVAQNETEANQDSGEATADNTSAEETAKEETEEINQNDELGKYYVTENIKIKLVPLINATDMIEIEKDKEVNVSRILNGWAYIELENSTTRGWIRLDKLKSESQKKADDEAKAAEEAAAAEAAAKEAELNAPAIKTSFIQTEKVNLRKEANTTSEILERITKNTEVEVLSEENGWSKCRVNGKVGFISTEYLGDEKVEEVTSRAATESRTPAAPVSSNATSVVGYAQGLLGSQYVSGGKGPNSFDCSGFVQYVYKQFGITLGGSTYSQIGNGTSVDKANLAPGDLVFFNGNSHVGIYMGNDTFIHAANSKRGVVTDRFSTYGTFYGARRVM